MSTPITKSTPQPAAAPETVEHVPELHYSYRDPNDVRLHLRGAAISLALIALLFISLGMNIYQFVRSPDLIVAVTTESGNRVVKLNDREYGRTDAVQLGPDKLSDEDKRYIASEFSKALYALDPASRPRDIERALRMMVPNEAVKYANFLKQSGQLEQQRRERWQAVWVQQDNTVDRTDPYTVHIIGEQQITKVIGEQVVHENVQLALDFKLVADLPRSDRNLRSGFLIGPFTGRELSRATVAN